MWSFQNWLNRAFLTSTVCRAQDSSSLTCPLICYLDKFALVLKNRKSYTLREMLRTLVSRITIIANCSKDIMETLKNSVPFFWLENVRYLFPRQNFEVNMKVQLNGNFRSNDHVFDFIFKFVSRRFGNIISAFGTRRTRRIFCSSNTKTWRK